jgi:DNA-binding MurR/RpiR family transcriptional regulator
MEGVYGMDLNPITVIKEKVADLPKSQRKVADYIINNQTEVAFLTLDQLAQLVGTSTTTVMRMAFNLGYSGYSEFQKSLQELFRNQSAPQTRLEINIQKINNSELWERFAETQIQNIKNTLGSVSEDVLNEFIELIMQSKRIYCTSVRSGLPVAQYLTQGINRLIGNCELIIADVSDWVDKSVNLTSEDLLIAVSYPRYANRVVDYARVAKENNCKIVSITDSYSSPIVKYADLVVPTSSESIAFHNSPISAMILVDYIISAIAIKYPKSTKERLDKVNSILLNMNYHHEK